MRVFTVMVCGLSHLGVVLINKVSYGEITNSIHFYMNIVTFKLSGSILLFLITNLSWNSEIKMADLMTSCDVGAIQKLCQLVEPPWGFLGHVIFFIVTKLNENLGVHQTSPPPPVQMNRVRVCLQRRNIRITQTCTRMLLEFYSYVARMLLVCCSYVTFATIWSNWIRSLAKTLARFL